MSSRVVFTTGTLLIAASLLSACAPSISMSTLTQPNYGLRVLPHVDAAFDPDPMTIADGLYAPRFLQDPCFRCVSQPRLNWAGWSP
jgi:hypothetical protein